VKHCPGKDDSARKKNYNFAKRDIETFYKKRNVQAEQTAYIDADKTIGTLRDLNPYQLILPGTGEAFHRDEKGGLPDKSMVSRSVYEDAR
jgi:hypothetical protein